MMRWTLALVFLGCSARGGYAEPGPLSQSAMPSNPSIASSGALQPSPPSGRASEIPPAVGPGGNAIAPAHDDAVRPTECVTDLDCVPAACCHARACVLRSRAPRCAEVMCTQICESDTLDCGGGSCACVRGQCAARMRN
jgi:hypothetical protein